MKELKAIRMLTPLLSQHPWAISAMVVLGFLEALSEALGISLFIPLLYSVHQENFGPAGDTWLGRALQQVFQAIPPSDRLWVISLSIFGLVLLRSALSYGNVVLYSWTDARLSHRLRYEVHDQLLHVGIAFFERSESGKLLNTLEVETSKMSEALSTLVGLVINLGTILVFTTLLVLISWQLTLLVAVALILISVMVRLMTRRVEALSRAAVRADEALSQRILEVFRGMRTIRTFGRESYEQEQFANASRRLGRIDFKQDILSGLIHPVSELLVASLLIFVLLTALQNPQNLATVLVFIFILYRLHPQVSDLNHARNDLIASTASVEEVLDVLDPRTKPYIRSGPIAFKGLQETIRFESVSFRYDPAEPPALGDVSIRILQRKTTALVGPSGAGKSTLINLILRLYDPTGGTIYVDDVPLQQLDLASWRRRIAVVSQDIHVFNTTVRQNIAYGRLQATEEEIITAARQADAHEFICALPQGYGTKVGDQGVRLSAGQKQRIALARALVHGPEILILDEATNALDSISEHVIQESLQKLQRDRTVIIIAHRLSTIERADQVLVLDSGRIVEHGSASQLLQNEALFAKLHELQNRHSLLEKEVVL